MLFFDYLLSRYGYNEAILLSELTFNGYSQAWIKKAVAALCTEQKLARFDKGVYYIPTDTVLGKSLLDPRKVIAKKYLYQGGETIGYFSGVTLMNTLGLSTQMPQIIELYTNNEKARVRDVSVGKLNVRLRKARADITSQNAQTMCFLELMNDTDAAFYDDEKRELLADFMQQNGVSKRMITACLPYFPDKAMRTLVESEIVYRVAQ